ncbi:MAG TPA: helix-turn-helix domain-containing protein [Ilumatobacteraceae bacterium]|nr:helix-turn-helix domain-containing protein [Ilumatobacteraceae bacterium]
MAAARSNTSQTLDRGLRVLEVIATADEAPSIEDLAGRLEVHRSIAYRIVRTLELHALIWRDSGGRCHPGDKLAQWARASRTALEIVARPELTALADDLSMTAFVVVRVGGHAVTLDSVEPQRTAAHVAYRPGSRHPIDRGAPGIAILAGQPVMPGERPEVAESRRRGWAYSSGEVVPGLASVATWVTDPHHGVASVACVFLAGVEVDLNAIAARVVAGAGAIDGRLASGDAPGALAAAMGARVTRNS